jgi:hypothetical protein
MTKLHRVQVLFDLDQYQKLAEIAKREGTSISFQVRRAVDQWLSRHGGRLSNIELAADIDIFSSPGHGVPLCRFDHVRVGE